MSEESLAYYLRSDHIEDAFGLLDRWKQKGYVYPPREGWVTLVTHGNSSGEDREGDQNGGLLLRFWPMTTHGWHFTFWEGDAEVASYSRGWLRKKIDFLPPDLLDWLTRRLPYLQEHRGELASLLRIEGRTCDLNGEETVRRFAELLNLFFFDGLTYQLLDRNPRDAVDADRWLAYEPQAGTPFSATTSRGGCLSETDFVAPRVLYATRKDAEREWLKLTRKVWKGASWAEVLQDIEMVRLGDLGRDICLHPPATGSSLWNEKMWRLHVVGDCLLKLRNQARVKDGLPPEEIDRRIWHASTIPTNPFWFEVGQMFAVSECLLHKETSSSWRYLERLVSKLPDLVRLQDSFQCPIVPSFRNSWVLVFSEVARFCGWRIPGDASTDILKSPDEMIALLIGHEVIRRDGDRFQLNPAP